MPTPTLSPRLLIWLIMAAVAIWGLYLSIGSYLYNHDPWRGLIVLGCFAAYLAIWLLLLRSRRSASRD